MMIPLIVTAALAIPPVTPAPTTPPRLTAALGAAVARASASGPRSAFAQDDSVKDGALKGAVAGAIAGAGVWYGICRVMDDTGGSGDCVEPEMLGSAALFAGIGALVGAGVDKLAVTNKRVQVSFRF